MLEHQRLSGDCSNTAWPDSTRARGCMKQTKQEWPPGDISLQRMPTRLHCFRAHCLVPAGELSVLSNGRAESSCPYNLIWGKLVQTLLGKIVHATVLVDFVKGPT